jgi:hypothetical protein
MDISLGFIDTSNIKCTKLSPLWKITIMPFESSIPPATYF